MHFSEKQFTSASVSASFLQLTLTPHYSYPHSSGRLLSITFFCSCSRVSPFFAYVAWRVVNTSWTIEFTLLKKSPHSPIIKHNVNLIVHEVFTLEFTRSERATTQRFWFCKIISLFVSQPNKTDLRYYIELVTHFPTRSTQIVPECAIV